jgi:hydroxyacylglutathione hydrolase
MSGAFPIAPDVWCVTSGVFLSNCYILRLSDSDKCVVIDPGLDGEAIKAQIEELALTPVAILCTHGHFDHVGSAAFFQNIYDCPVYLHNRERDMLKSVNFLLMAFKINLRIDMPKVEFLIEDTGTLQVSGHAFQYCLTPGHTPGSIVFRFKFSLFTGDTLYADGVGFSKLPGEHPNDLRHSIKGIFRDFLDTDQICPGHGKSATLGWVKENNLALLDFLKSTTK